ncbi:single-stranded-DNA-specific exonuclease RecJ [Virgibacillus sp. DJP39]|uniref:single-stranded-DNA-specific exonuclease RecJ n=1 Tax=Virgibacillus sp. DJP39 TaxID=3409790 RepID=UPI003BB76173
MNKTIWMPVNPALEDHPEKQWMCYLAKIIDMDPKLMYWLFIQGFDNQEKVYNLLFPTLDDFHNPFLLNDMNKAVHRIIKAIKQKEKVLIFGDYDCDGITATTILYKALNEFKANVSFRLPLREEGYGITPKAVEEIADQNTGLIITVDNGTSAHDAIKVAKEKGIDVIVTDHHDMLDAFPQCLAFINPKRPDNTYPFSDLCGAGVAMKLVQALFSVSKRKWDQHAGPYIDLATIGTIADLVSLQGENRAICHAGLKRMNICPQDIFKKLFKVLNVKSINSSTIAFQVGPILNAVGRVDNPNRAVHLLANADTTEDELKELININRKRQSMTMTQYLHAEKEIIHHKLYKQNVIVIKGDYFKGIIGIIASRISEKYKKPSIVISDCGTGSCRGVNGTNFSIINTLNRCESFFSKFGGHKAAAGFSLKHDDIEAFKLEVQRSASHEAVIEPIMTFLCQLPLHYFSRDMASDINALEPFGMGFEKPIFYSGRATPRKVKAFGQAKQHLSFNIGNKKVTAFSKGNFADTILGKDVDFLYRNQDDSFLVQDIKFSKGK